MRISNPLLVTLIAMLVVSTDAAAQRTGRSEGARDSISRQAHAGSAGSDALAFLREPQKRLRVELEDEDELLELSNARWNDDRIGFDYAWSTVDPLNLRDGLPPLALDRVRAVYRHRTNRAKGALFGGLAGLATGVLVTVIDDRASSDRAVTLLAYTGVAAFIGLLRSDFTRWERVYP